MTASLLQRLENVPLELKQRRQWVGYQAKLSTSKPGRVDKVPVNPATKRNASTSDPSTWCTFEDAVACTERNDLAGVGFVFSGDDPYVGIDLDHCVDEDGCIAQWAIDLACAFDTYAELSP